MKNKIYGRTRSIAIDAILSAFSVIILAFGSIIDTLDLTLAALCSIIVWFVVIEFGIKNAASIYFVTSALSLLLLPSKYPAFEYAMFAGWYPLLKPYLHKIKSKIPRLLLKLLIFNSAALLLYKAVEYFITVNQNYGKFNIAAFLIISNAAFLLFDWLLTRLIWFYYQKIRLKLVKAGIVKK